MKILNQHNSFATILLLSIIFTSCRKFSEVDPPITKLPRSVVFDGDATATAAIAGTYASMMEFEGFASYWTPFATGLSSDELVNYSNNSSQIKLFTNSLSSLDITGNIFWSEPYKYIFQANTIIEGLAESQKVTAATKQQLEGEAKFLRAFCHFYLVNLYGDVPLILTTDYRVNQHAPRLPEEQVYQQIIADLQEAQNLLSENYVTGERVRPNKYAATALLARVYLYRKDWANAATQATAVINNSGVYSLTADLSNVFLKNSTEAIWQLMPVNPYGFNTWEGANFILTAPPTASFVDIRAISLTDDLVAAFEDEDLRKSMWLGNISDGLKTYYYSYKYKVLYGLPVTEYSMVLRLAEQYLIRSEARVHQDDIAGGLDDLNVIRARAGLDDMPVSLTKQQVLDAIEQERRVELFTEWGHRWLDLKRTGRSDAVLSAVKSDWQSTDQLYPIPQSQISNSPAFKDQQNPGY